MRASFDLDEDYVYSVFLRTEDDTEGDAIGSCGIHAGPAKLTLVPSKEIGYWVDYRQRGKGFGTEIATALTIIAFKLLKTPRVEIHCASTNDPSSGTPYVP